MTRSAPIPVATGGPPRAASLAICAGECGAQCCRAPGRFSMERREFERLQKLARLIGLDRWMVEQDPEDPEWFVSHHRANGDACPFLDQASNLCRIYDERPSACRKYPTVPENRCRLWDEP